MHAPNFERDNTSRFSQQPSNAPTAESLYSDCVQMLNQRQAKDFNAARDTALSMVRSVGIRYPKQVLDMNPEELNSVVPDVQMRPYIGKALWVLALFEKMYFKKPRNALLVVESANAVAPTDPDILRTYYEFGKTGLEGHLTRTMAAQAPEIIEGAMRILNAIDRFLELRFDLKAGERLATEILRVTSNRDELAWCFENGSNIARALAEIVPEKSDEVTLICRAEQYNLELLSVFGIPQNFEQLAAYRAGQDRNLTNLSEGELKRIGRAFKALACINSTLKNSNGKTVADKLRQEFEILAGISSKRGASSQERPAVTVPKPPVSKPRIVATSLPKSDVTQHAEKPKGEEGSKLEIPEDADWDLVRSAYARPDFPREIEERVKDAIYRLDFGSLSVHDVKRHARELFVDLEVVKLCGIKAVELYFDSIRKVLNRDSSDAILVARSQVALAFLGRRIDVKGDLKQEISNRERNCERTLRHMSLGKAHGALKSVFTQVANVR